MPGGIDEALRSPNQLGSDLQAGVDAISESATVTFTKYVRLVLPLDGTIFWIRADMLSTGALYNAAQYNKFAFNQYPKIITPAPTVVAKGSLHYATNMQQEEDHTFSVNRVVFTSEQPITDLNEIGPTVLFIGVIRGVKFAFSERGSFYWQSRLWHYRGAAIYSDMYPQIIDSLAGLDTRNVVVSNSLPAWLAFNGYNNTKYGGFANPVTLYPSFLVPPNLIPPFGSVHIPPESTQALAAAPEITQNSSHYQLTSERVKITLWGTRNFNAMDFIDAVNQYSLDTDVIGIMNIPTIRDEKRTQVELAAIAQKKSVEYEISYTQQAVRDIALQYITNAIPGFQINA